MRSMLRAYVGAILSVIRSSGGDAVFGLLGVAIAMLSIGLAFVALEDDNEIAELSLVPFGVAVFFFVLSIGASLYLAIRAARIAKKITGVMGNIRSGLRLRRAVREHVFADERIQHWLDAWEGAVVLWIESEEPDYLVDFELASGVPFTFTGGGISNFANRVVRHMDGKLGALQALLSHLRASR